MSVARAVRAGALASMIGCAQRDAAPAPASSPSRSPLAPVVTVDAATPVAVTAAPIEIVIDAAPAAAAAAPLDGPARTPERARPREAAQEREPSGWRFPIPKDADNEATDAAFEIGVTLSP